MNRLSIVATMALAAFAAMADDGWLSFSTEGPDTYCDGTPVLKGESYALVWTANEAFGGIAADGSPAVEGDRVIVSAPVAKEGAKGMHCPEVIFQVKRSTLDELGDAGRFSVVVLDTRVKSGETVAPAPRSGGRPLLVNGWGEVSAEIRSVTAGTVDEGEGDGKCASVMARAPSGVQQPKVKSISLDGDNAVLTVENLGGYVRAQGGTDTSASDTTGPAQADESGADITLVMPKPGEKSGFFKVIGN